MKHTTRACIFIAALLGANAHAATIAYQNAVLADNPILYYHLNELAGNAANHGSLGAAFDAAYNGTPLRGVATAGGDTGVAFDGADDFLESLGVSPAAVSGNPTFTAEALVFVPLGGFAVFWAPLLHWGDGGPGVRTGKEVYFSFSNNDATEFFAGFYNGGLQNADPLALGVWRHVVWVRNGGGNDQTGSTLYVDGVGVEVATEPDPALCCNGSIPAVTQSEFRINRARDGNRFFIGTLDEVVLYDSALDAGDVQAHYLATLVPVPQSILLLAPALAMLVRRIRRRPGNV